jgi:hypothetical protein
MLVLCHPILHNIVIYLYDVVSVSRRHTRLSYGFVAKFWALFEYRSEDGLADWPKLVSYA